MSELVSIIMPSYNTAKYIEASIESVLAQTYRNWELLIIDDFSMDNTDDIVKKYDDKRIVYVKNEKNTGAAVSRNKALKMAKGKWIAFLDSDDLWYPTKLEKQVEFMKKNKYSFSYTDYNEIDSTGKETGVKVTGPKKISRRGMLRYCWMGCLTVMYDAEKVGLIQINDIRKNNDYAMWLKVSEKCDCYLLDEYLASYRKGRNGSISTQKYTKLIKWHYLLFRNMGVSKLGSVYWTLNNILFGLIKKIIFVKRVKKC